MSVVSSTPTESLKEREDSDVVPLLKSDSVRAILALADQAFVSINTFLTMVLVAKFCSPASFNLFVLGFSIFVFFKVALDRALSAPYAVFANQPEREKSRFLGSSLVHCFCIGAASSVLMQLIAVAFSQFSTLGNISWTICVFGIVTPFMLLRDFLRAVSAAHFRYGFALLLSISALIIQAGGIVFLSRVGWLQIHWLIACVGLANLLPSLVWLYLRPQGFRILREKIWSDGLHTFQYSKWLLLARIFPAASSSLLPWIVLCLISEDAAGAFAACSSLANVSMMFVYGAISFLQPRAVQAFHQQGYEGLARILLAAAALFSITLSSLCVVLWFFGGWCLTLLYSARFADQGVLVTLLAANVLIVSYSVVAGIGIASLEKPRGILWGELSYSVVAVVGTVILSWCFGLVGAGTALCFASSISTIVSFCVLRHFWQQANNNSELVEPETVGGNSK